MSTASAKPPSSFTPKDLYNLQLLSHLNHKQVELSNQPQNNQSLVEQFKTQSEVTQAVRDVTKFLSLFTEQSAGARILMKEQINVQLAKTAQKALTQAAIMAKIHGKNPDGSLRDPIKYSPEGESSLRDKMLKMPHIASAFNQEIQPSVVLQEKNVGALNNVAASIRDKFGALASAVSGNQPAEKMNNNPYSKPGAGGPMFNHNGGNGGPPQNSASFLQNQIGISISSGNYINTQKDSANEQDNLPTWKKLTQDTAAQAFYTNAFNIQAPRRDNDNQSMSHLPDYLQKASFMGSQNQNKGVKRPYQDQADFNDGAFRVNGQLRDPKNDRLQRIIDSADGQDLDINKVGRYLAKQNMVPEDRGVPQGFISGTQQFKIDQQNKKKGLGGQDGYNNERGGYGGGYGGGGQNKGYGNNNGGYGQNNNYNNYNSYNNQGPPNNNNQLYDDDNSATDRLFNNQGRQPGLGGRKKFVPPTKGGNQGSGGGQSGNFHPGKSVMQHMVNNNGKQDDKNGEGNIEIQQDERYKNLDPKMVELIENEIMERQPKVSWNDIAGLEFAKKTIQEIIIWPMLRPDIFKGIRAPPRGVMFFGPPGTGKTLLGKAIAAQSKSTFMSISASTLTSKWVGEGEKMVRTMFAIAAIHQPTVIFIDEIDSLLCARNDNDMESSRRIKTEFLVQLDGANTFAGENARILIIGATNRPDDLDEAVRRRLVKRLYIPLPNYPGRKQFIQRLIEHEMKTPEGLEHQNGPHINLDEAGIDELVNMTKGYSGADLKALSAEAAMIPLRSIEDIENCDAANIRPLTIEDFRVALDNVKATVNQNDLRKFLEFNENYGSFQMKDEDLKD